MDAIEITALQTRARVIEISCAMKEATKLVSTEAPEVYSKDLIETIFHHPYCKIQFLEEAGIAKRQTASKYLKTLAKLGILSSLKKGREQYYINTALMKILSDDDYYV